MGDLWCIHILGPDDVFPAPNRAEADAKAKELNTFIGRHLHANDDDATPRLSVVVERWPYDAASHEEGLSQWVPAA